MNIKETETTALLERRAAIVTECETATGDTLADMEAEMDAINAELETRKAAEEKRRAIRAAVVNGAGDTIDKIDFKEERKTNMKDITEYRNSKEYIDLYADMMKTGNKEEIRAALLTTNAEDGTIPVPDFVYDIVKTAWDRNEIMRLVNRVSLPGNLKVSFEISGTDAVIHTEGGDPVAEEELVEGVVTLIPEFAKKWKSFSKTVYKLRGEAFVRYIYDELTYRIIKVIADSLIAKIAALPAAATSTQPAAAKITGAPAVGLVAEAMGNLSDEATNPVVVMNKGSWAAFKAAQYAGNFDTDPFEGLDVHFNNSLPVYSTASSGAVYAIVGDFQEGALANFPDGESVEFTFDELTRKKENLIEVLGELFVSAEPVASNAFTLIAKA